MVNLRRIFRLLIAMLLRLTVLRRSLSIGGFVGFFVLLIPGVPGFAIRFTFLDLALYDPGLWFSALFVSWHGLSFKSGFGPGASPR
jgi:hypothetical protein